MADSKKRFLSETDLGTLLGVDVGSAAAAPGVDCKMAKCFSLATQRTRIC